MKLIREHVENVKYLTEKTESGKKNYFIEGIFMQADRVNRNKRSYPFETLNKEVQRYNEQYVATNRAFGELGHPDTPSINLDRVSHIIKELKSDGANFYGKAKILETPYGNIVRNLIDEGAQLGVSSRGMGSLAVIEGTNVVQDDFMLATAADIVADPSAPDAFVSGIMEGREWMFVEGKFVEVDIANAKKQIKQASRNQIEQVAFKLFEGFLKKL
jgi:hypothetical protein